MVIAPTKHVNKRLFRSDKKIMVIAPTKHVNKRIFRFDKKNHDRVAPTKHVNKRIFRSLLLTVALI